MDEKEKREVLEKTWYDLFHELRNPDKDEEIVHQLIQKMDELDPHGIAMLDAIRGDEPWT